MSDRPPPVCRKCGHPITTRYAFGSKETGWEHMEGECIESSSDYSAVLREYLDLYANQPPRQAEMIVPGWALERLNALPQEQRRSILLEIDQIAAMHGLLTPTKLIVTPNA